MIERKAPADYGDCPRPWVFLAGSIEMGTAERWQERVVKALNGFGGTVLNPRRDDWDSSWQQRSDNPQFRAQVEWELAAQEASDLVLMYFSPATKAPITLLELGLLASSGRVIVCCPEGFWRKGNVDVVCARHGVHRVKGLGGLVKGCWRRLPQGAFSASRVPS